MVEWDNEQFGRRFQANNRVLMHTGIGQIQMGRWYNIGFTSKSATHISIAECVEEEEPIPLETRVVEQIVQVFDESIFELIQKKISS